MRITFKSFRGVSWEDACKKAEKFVNNLQPNQVSSIAHGNDKQGVIVFVWYVDYVPTDAARTTVHRSVARK